MQDITVRMIGAEDAEDIRLKNEPFRLFGRMVPTYLDGAWSFTVTQTDGVAEDVFPDEDYDYAEMAKDCVFIGAYDGKKCVGLAILQKQWYKYVYLYDLKVCKAYRRRHIATRLMEKAFGYAREAGFRGVWTVGQDTNLGACLFYVHSGFRVGGLNTEVYNGTKLDGTADICFYKDLL